jgi:Glycosyltransferase family 87
MPWRLAARQLMRLYASNSERLLRYAWLLLLVLTISLYLLRQVADGPYGKDFTSFLTGAHLLLDGHASQLYSISAQTAAQKPLAGPFTYLGGVLPFMNPPYVAAFFMPVALFPADQAFYVWLVVQWIVLVCWVVWVMRSFRGWGENAPDLLPIAIFSFAPIIEALLMGQLSIISMVLWWWAFVSWRSGKDVQLGVAAALLLYKPQIALLLFVALFAQKKWRALASAVILQAALWLGAVLVCGPGVVTSYIDMLRLSASTVGIYGLFPSSMPNLRGLLTNMGVPTDITTWVALAAWLLSLVATYIIWSRSTIGFIERFGITVLLAVVFSPHLNTHDVALLILVVICILLSHVHKPEQVFAQIYPFFLLLFLSIYTLVLGPWRSNIPTIVSTWLFAAMLLLMLLQPVWHRRAQTVVPGS